MKTDHPIGLISARFIVLFLGAVARRPSERVILSLLWFFLMSLSGLVTCALGSFWPVAALREFPVFPSAQAGPLVILGMVWLASSVTLLGLACLVHLDLLRLPERVRVMVYDGSVLFSGRCLDTERAATLYMRLSRFISLLLLQALLALSALLSFWLG